MPLFRVWVHCQRASSGLLPRRSNLLGYVRWDARSDRFLLARQSVQQLFRSQFALSHESIPQVLSCEGPRKRLPAFASGNVVDVAKRNRYPRCYSVAFASFPFAFPQRYRSALRRFYPFKGTLRVYSPGHDNVSKLSEIKGYEVFRADRTLAKTSRKIK